MIDDSITARLLSEHTSNEISFLDDVKYSINEAEDSNDQYLNQYCLAMIHSALKEGNQYAQKWLEHNLYSEVLELMQHHPKKDMACNLHTEEYYVNETFRRFWQISLYHQENEYESLSNVLYYLHVSLNGVVLDAMRSYARLDDVPILISGMVDEGHSTENESSHEVWQTLEMKLHGQHERRLAYLLFLCALKPWEVVRNFPEDFNDVQEVSRMRRDMIEILIK